MGNDGSDYIPRTWDVSYTSTCVGNWKGQFVYNLATKYLMCKGKDQNQLVKHETRWLLQRIPVSTLGISISRWGKALLKCLENFCQLEDITGLDTKCPYFLHVDKENKLLSSLKPWKLLGYYFKIWPEFKVATWAYINYIAQWDQEALISCIYSPT